jgi:hypothetical protein
VTRSVGRALLLLGLAAGCVHWTPTAPGDVLVMREGLLPECAYDAVGPPVEVTTTSPESFPAPEQLLPSTTQAIKEATKKRGAQIALVLSHVRGEAYEKATAQPIRCRHEPKPVY